MPYREYLPKSVPPWLQAKWGRAFLDAVGARMDNVVGATKEAVFARLPEFAPSDAQDVIGADRGLPRGGGESDEDYGARLVDAWNIWGGDNTPLTGKGGGAGSARGILLQLKALGLPTGSDGATVYNHNGRYAQLDGSDEVVFGDGPVAVNRSNLLGLVPGNLKGFTLDWRDQFYAKFGILFPVDVPALRPNTQLAAAINRMVDRWRQAKEHYVGAFVIEAGGGWDWPATQTWDDGTLWNSDTVHFIPPP
jgi:hypothetical protein